jgi:hypothetical protein
MTQPSTSHLGADSLDEYSTQAEYCRQKAERTGGAFDESWVLLAMAWTKLADEAKARSSPEF